MPQRAALAIVASAIFAVTVVAPSHAALTTDQAKCQSTAAKQGRTYFKKRFKALSSCHDAINSGKLDTTTDCTLEAKAADKLAKAEQGLRDKLASGCTDPIVAGLAFGGSCAGVTTVNDLGDCLVAQHDASTDALIALAYDADSARTCDGTMTACTSSANCGGNPCVLSSEQSGCLKSLSKALGKLANSRLGVLNKCKKSVAKGKLPDGTNCIANGEVKIDAAFDKTVAAIQGACPALVASSLKYGGVCDKQTDTDSIAACSTCSVNRAVDDLILAAHGSSAVGGATVLKQITNMSECVGGTQSRCRVNDYLLSNDKIRVVIQDIQRNMFTIGQFGGQIIDGDLVRTSGPDRDSFEEWALSLNIENTAHYTSLTIINDGSDGGPATLRATGVDDLLDFINPSSTVASFGFALPGSANDVDLPVTVTTDYTLAPGTNYVQVKTTVTNLGGSVLNIFFGEYINGSGQPEMFQPGYGFGEPLVTSVCPTSKPNLCNFTAFAGVDESDGVSYGYVHETPGSSTFSTSGVHVPQLNVDVVLALVGLASPPFFIQPTGNPGDELTMTRYFVVGGGSVSDISDTRNEIDCVPTGTLSGTVTAGGNPAVRAAVAVLGNTADGPPGVSRNVVTHTRTDDNGNFSFTLPPGTYDVAANLDGYPYEGGGATPALHSVTISAFGTQTQNIALPATGGIQVTAVDQDSDPSPAKVSVVGFDPSTDLAVTQNVLGLINNRTAVFGDRGEDSIPFGMAATYFLEPDGTSAVRPLEPGSYQVYVSRGPEYSLYSAPITVTAGSTQTVNATVDHVIDTDGFVSSDFHVHSIDSPDAQVKRTDRVRAMLAEGVDFFASTDHDFRADFQPTIDALGATAQIGTAPGEEITSFDYGHFNAWPMTIDPTKVNNGSVDFGGAAPAGADYPSSGNYNETPESIIGLAHAAAPGANNTVQVNHVHSFFGLDGGSGLAIDTGLTPPASAVAGAARRLNPAVTNYFTDDFDALEIWIGDDRAQVTTNFLGQNAGDWFNLINQGIVKTGVADSDTHNRFTNVSGFPRNMVASPSDDPGDLSGLADTLSANVNAGRSFGTNAPMVRVSASADSTGQTASLELGDSLSLSTTDGAVDIDVEVQSPTWAEFDTIEFYVNSTTTRTMSNKQSGAGLVSVKRYSITPDFVKSAPGDFTVNTVPVAGTSSSRLEASTTLSLTGLTEDSWVVVMVKGKDGISRPLYPVLPNSLKTSTNTNLAQLTDGNLGEDGITALAFTNPLFIDVDGGGWTAPGVQINP
ncbi:MAG: CehA/McbA family metallohydrolase [Deltaproteobacteria bacterium]|nr:CehA/McbA family metallohydrolase [Deltaproteobacteria bacterium]